MGVNHDRHRLLLLSRTGWRELLADQTEPDVAPLDRVPPVAGKLAYLRLLNEETVRVASSAQPVDARGSDMPRRCPIVNQRQHPPLQRRREIQIAEIERFPQASFGRVEPGTIRGVVSRRYVALAGERSRILHCEPCCSGPR
jgi:hypothetical protein